ncbi:MAG: hypothetical protein QOE90_2626 [Thermoplasmata archaeon]|jgi:sporulation protein YlmC with PRC-barrel domain|nr:hypothetical protein [Thermoplasmata archaeon]
MHPPGVSPFAPDELLEKRVFDVNGRAVGRVRAVEPAEGLAHAINVGLADDKDVWLSAASIVSAEEDVVLNDEAEVLLRRDASR